MCRVDSGQNTAAAPKGTPRARTNGPGCSAPRRCNRLACTWAQRRHRSYRRPNRQTWVNRHSRPNRQALSCFPVSPVRQGFFDLQRIRPPWNAGCGAAKVSSLALLKRSPTPPPTSLDLCTQSSLQLSRMRSSLCWAPQGLWAEDRRPGKRAPATRATCFRKASHVHATPSGRCSQGWRRCWPSPPPARAHWQPSPTHRPLWHRGRSP